MIKNIIFDIGNVLLNFQPTEYLKAKNIPADKILEVHHELFQSEEWVMLDRGTITEEEAKGDITKRSNGNEHLIGLAFENWYAMLTPIEDSIAILKELKNAGYSIYFLSNFHLLAFENVTKKHDFFQLFDGGVVSYKEKLIKPEKAIYDKLIERYNIKPEESIFIDDMQDNVEAAKKLNFNIIHLKNSKDLREELKAYKINF